MASPPEKGSDYFGEEGICQALAYGVTGARPPPSMSLAQSVMTLPKHERNWM